MSQSRCFFRILILSIFIIFAAIPLGCQCDSEDDEAPSSDSGVSGDDDLADDDFTDDDFAGDDDDVVSDDDDFADDDDDDTSDDDVPDPSDETGIFVSPSGQSGNPGTMQAPLRSINAGIIKAAQQGKVVFVSRGLYAESVRATVSLYGGYEDNNWTRDITGNITEINPPSGEGLRVPISYTGSLSIDGFVIHGHYDYTQDYDSSVAVYIAGGTVTLRRNLMPGFSKIHIPWDFPFDWKTFYGDTVYVNHTTESVTMIDNEIHGISIFDIMGTATIDMNTITMTDQNSSVKATLINNRIHCPFLGGNLASSAIGINTSQDTLMINNVIIQGAFTSGQGVVNYGNLTMINNTMIGKAATWAGVELHRGPAVLVNNIFSKEGSYPFPSVVIDEQSTGASVEMAGNIFAAPQGEALMRVKDADLFTISQIQACDWTGCVAAHDNMYGDPLLTSDQHLSQASPCIDAGVDPSPWSTDPALFTDFDGESRPAGGGWDMGADEYYAR